MQDSIPEAITVKKSRFSVVWLIPLIALMIGGWLTLKYLHEKGTTIQIEFASADGIAVGKTNIKFKDVVVGIVDDIAFSRNLQNVIITATIKPEMRDHLNEATRFWVVRARVAAGEISGLGTLLSGAHIGMEPGKSGKLKKSFKGLDNPPALLTNDLGRVFMLKAEILHSFEAGTPIYYRRLKVGEVLEYSLNAKGSSFDIEIFIRAPYDQLVYENSVFWNASGIDINVNADGFKMRTESMVALLQGGLSFDNLAPDETSRADSGAEFKLFASREKATEVDYKRSDQLYRLYFDGSARGLSIGAPVTLRGITLGKVVDIKLEYDLRDNSFKIPVTIEFEPDRLSIIGRESADLELPSTSDLVELGLRAQLRTGNILTGQMLIDFDLYPDARPIAAYKEDEFLVLPTIPTSIDSIKNSLTAIIEKIGNMPLEEMGVNLNGAIEGVNTLVNSSDVKEILLNINESSVQLNETLGSVNTLVHSSDVKEMLSNINQASLQLKSTLAQTTIMAEGLSEDSPAYQELTRTLRELSGASRALRQMAEYLERHPEALLKGKSR